MNNYFMKMEYQIFKQESYISINSYPYAVCKKYFSPISVLLLG